MNFSKGGVVEFGFRVCLVGLRGFGFSLFGFRLSCFWRARGWSCVCVVFLFLGEFVDGFDDGFMVYLKYMVRRFC